jgi:hypothetical protein
MLGVGAQMTSPQYLTRALAGSDDRGLLHDERRSSERSGEP